MKRLRACDTCHKIKIKCELGSEGGHPPCKRCSRLSKDCFIAPPISQKNRVAELEAEVESLRKLLESQNIRVDDARPLLENVTTSKKRRLEGSTPDEAFSEDDTKESRYILALDALVTIPIQKQILDRYTNEIVPKFTLVPLTDFRDYDFLRAKKPLLLQAIIYASCHGIISPKTQEELARLVLGSITRNLDSEVGKSIELIQAVQIVALWYRHPGFYTQVSLPQLVNFAIDVAKEVGISGPDDCMRLGPLPATLQADSSEASRAWLVCYVLSASFCTALRMRNFLRWTLHESSTLLLVEYSQHGTVYDRSLAQYARAERLCEEVATMCQLSDSAIVMDVNSEHAHATMTKCWGLFIDWQAQILPPLRPTLKFWEYTTRLYMHEHVLHTATNKKSFAGPYTAERLSVTDFPAPVVTQAHTDLLFALRENSHELMDLFLNLEITTMMSLPPLLFVSRVVYGQWILIKLYIATTAIGNTFSSSLNPESLKVENYLQKMIDTAHKVDQVDSSCGTAMILGISSRLKDWLSNYRTTYNISPPLFRYENCPETDVLHGTVDFEWGLTGTSADLLEHDLDTLLGEPLPDLDHAKPQS